MIRTRPYLLCCALLLLASCETMNDLTSWMGGEDDKAPLPGKRIPVLSDISHLSPDDSLASTDVVVPAPKANDDWREAGGAPAGMTGNLALPGLSHHDSAKIGDHNGWEQPLYPGPIVAGSTVYAMDAKGYITAHDATSIGKIRWTNKSAVTEDEADLLGGGLAFENGRLYVTSGRGKLYALDAASGKELWKQVVGVSLRVAPKSGGGKVYALSVDNQLFVFDADKGTPLWSHRGANENAGFLAAATPAITDSIVVVPYSSAEIHAVEPAGGQDVWSDTLLLVRRNSATGVFSGIGGNPIVKDDIVYAGGSSGFFAALALLNGRRMWEQNISTLNTPWIADDYIYVLSNDAELVCLMRADGRVKWSKQLPQYGNEKKHTNPLVWRGPVLAGGRLLVAGMHGSMLALSPKDGSTVDTIDIPDNITDAPVVAGGRLYFLTQDARLHVLY
jgi:outer membrane protein assembly factor BamB